MRRINKFLVLFIFVIVIFFAAIVNFIQSSYFGTIVSNQVNYRISQITDAQIEIEKISFSASRDFGDYKEWEYDTLIQKYKMNSNGLIEELK